MPRIDADIESFYQQHHQARPKKSEQVADTGAQVWQMHLPYLFLDLPFEIPYQEMFREAQQVRHLFHEHKSNKKHGHVGWLTLSVIEADKPSTAAEHCPITYGFFSQTFGFTNVYQVRFTIVTPGGMILPHTDNAYRHTETTVCEFRDQRHINLALNQPEGCEFVMADAGIVPMYEGCAVHLSTRNAHAVWNRSSVDRYHILVHGGATEATHWPATLLRSYQTNQE